MTTQKTFKSRVRARMAKTGERYTAAREQLTRKAARRGNDLPADPNPTDPPVELPTSEEAVRSATGRGWEEWFAILDAWGATERRHAEIARWLVAEQGIGGWWAQSVTGGYERARGMRAKHEMATGFSVGATRTVAAPLDRLTAAFVDPAVRGEWLADAPLQPRASRARSTVRFAWTDDGSAVVVYFGAKGDERSHVAVQHERLPDAAAADRMKAYWRERLGVLKELLER